MIIGMFSVAILELIVFLFFFELLTSYRCWEEIKKGNIAAALATGGKIFGICNIMRSAAAGATIYEFMIISAIGVGLLFGAYLLFEFLTPVFRIDREIGMGNRAVGIISLAVSVSVSFVIAACIALF
ncbi:hypothetical protein DCC85_06740 [Paenibacillus sp. CAA11]|uniref:DUF350 domain-containing protein n=1 Tax=Paenibacillus sp. CAA11 TaxID=1532905 RepID=UPI000D376A91|nr:DUF350 domain-containing protein [Paenibacillus sp. CAA11]AWB46846.1 hypothetical protein DCC85_06740 [Paenibacillus sp. CAA11]